MLGNSRRCLCLVSPTSGLAYVVFLSQTWCLLPQGTLGATGPAAKVKESYWAVSSIFRCAGILWAFQASGSSLMLLWLVTLQKNQTYRAFGTAMPFGTWPRWSWHALRKAESLGQEDPHCE